MYLFQYYYSYISSVTEENKNKSRFRQSGLKIKFLTRNSQIRRSPDVNFGSFT